MSTPRELAELPDMPDAYGLLRALNKKPLMQPLMPGTTVRPYGKIGAVVPTGGERYYMLSKNRGRDVALMPASVIEPLYAEQRPKS